MSDTPFTPAITATAPSATPSASAVTSEVVQPNTNEAGPHAEGGTELAKNSSPEEKKAPTEQEIKAAIKKWNSRVPERESVKQDAKDDLSYAEGAIAGWNAALSTHPQDFIIAMENRRKQAREAINQIEDGS